MYASDNRDGIPRDGMGISGTYPGGGPDGTPNDENAWFNLLPQNVSERPLSYYAALPGGDPRKKMPFPGANGKMWQCPSATMSASDYTALSGGGANGFFSYAFNIDLKKSPGGGNMAYPAMPKISDFHKPSSTVLMFDVVFNPVTEIVNGSPQFNSVNPANRYRSIGVRHELGTVMAFCDGHSKTFKILAVTNTAAGTSASGEPLNPDIIWDWTTR
jgi:prepilin-type processing-associated H-X9-DG protein